MPSPDEEHEDQWVEISRSGTDHVATANVRDKHEVYLDEPTWQPIGNDAAPWPSNYLLVATAGCQIEVMAQALEKARIDEYGITIRAHFDREDIGPDVEDYPDHLSWWYTDIVMDIDVETPEENEAKMERLLDLAEQACVVSRSVEHGINFEISKSLSLRPTRE